MGALPYWLKTEWGSRSLLFSSAQLNLLKERKLDVPLTKGRVWLLLKRVLFSKRACNTYALKLLLPHKSALHHGMFARSNKWECLGEDEHEHWAAGFEIVTIEIEAERGEGRGWWSGRCFRKQKRPVVRVRPHHLLPLFLFLCGRRRRLRHRKKKFSSKKYF